MPMNGRLVSLMAILLITLAIWPGSSQAAGTQTVTIRMGEEGARMYFRPDLVTLRSGVKVDILLVNVGKKPHEWMVYEMPRTAGKPEHMWTEEHTYFKRITAAVTGKARVERSEAGDLLELEVKAGQQATVTFTPTRKGRFQMGCLLPEHWERGMKGTVVVK